MSRSIMLNLEERKNIKRHNTMCKKILTKLVQNYHNTKDKTYFLIAIDNIIDSKILLNLLLSYYLDYI